MTDTDTVPSPLSVTVPLLNLSEPAEVDGEPSSSATVKDAPPPEREVAVVTRPYTENTQLEHAEIRARTSLNPAVEHWKFPVAVAVVEADPDALLVH